MRNHQGRSRNKILQLITPLVLAACGSSKKTDGYPNLEKLEGSPNADYIQATTDADLIVALSGDDRIYAYAGNDQIYPGSGLDTVYAGEGDDIIFIDALGDYIDGGLGYDTLTIVGALLREPLTADLRQGNIVINNNITGIQTELNSIENLNFANVAPLTIYTSIDDNIIETGPAGDKITLVAGNDIVNANEGNDIITILSGSHQINLGEGGDITSFSSGFQKINGGLGSDTIEFVSPQKTQLTIDVVSGELRSSSSILAEFEQIEKFQINGGPGIFLGSEKSESFTGSDYSDEFFGNGGTDIYQGNLGNDLFHLSTKGQSYTKILDLDISDSLDLIKISRDGANVTSNGENIITVNFSEAGTKLISNQNSIFRFISEPGFNADQDILMSLNGQSGITTISEIILKNACMVALWYDEAESATKISLVADTNSNGTLDYITTFGELTNITQSDLLQITTDSFIIS